MSNYIRAASDKEQDSLNFLTFFKKEAVNINIYLR